MDPLTVSDTKMHSSSAVKTPQSFLGENSGLVNLDQLIKASSPSNIGPAAAYNPFGDIPQPKTNLFQQQTQPVNEDPRKIA